MRIALTVALYTIVFALMGALLIGFAFQLLAPEQITTFIYRTYDDLNWRIILGGAGFLLILINLATAQMMSGKIQREKTIAFANPNGQVTITLSAVEDLIKRLSQQLREIKDARAAVKAGKKGIDIKMRVVLRSETNIPDFTAKLQSLIATKIQDVFGIDEAISVKIHVAKILSIEEKPKKVKTEKVAQEPVVPYQSL